MGFSNNETAEVLIVTWTIRFFSNMNIFGLILLPSRCSRRWTGDLRFCQLFVLWLRRVHRVVPRFSQWQRLFVHVAVQDLVFASTFRTPQFLSIILHHRAHLLKFNMSPLSARSGAMACPPFWKQFSAFAMQSLTQTKRYVSFFNFSSLRKKERNSCEFNLLEHSSFPPEMILDSLWYWAEILWLKWPWFNIQNNTYDGSVGITSIHITVIRRDSLVLHLIKVDGKYE